jgi:trimethylamine:corrinoid methyltransferase-like protein
MPFEKGNKHHEKRKKKGRAGYGIENAKKHLLEQAYWIVNKKLEKQAIELSEKEKIELAKQVVLKELGSKVDITSKGDKIEQAPIYAGKSNISI